MNREIGVKYENNYAVSYEMGNDCPRCKPIKNGLIERSSQYAFKKEL